MPAKKKTTKKVAAKKTAKKAAKKTVKVASKKVAKKATKKVARKRARPAFTSDDIEKAAYLIYLKRQETGEPGDCESDWLEAERLINKTS